MVKADIKHNYYADLELPNTCSIDEIKKQYRKLALQYHPDRNAGKEEEYVPKFQAIQTAHEILGDATQKQVYDADRRKAGLYPPGATFRNNQHSTGHPYTAASDFPPPPRRTQPGTWQRTQPAAGGGASPYGADRFAQSPRAAPTARKDTAGTQERANMFRAWQNMNAQTKQERERAHDTPPQPKTPNRRRPPPPPRPESRIPTEEEIRAGMNYRKAPAPPRPANSSRPVPSQSAWQAYQQSGPNTPGISRSKTFGSARKQGFDPNVPGSDERPASHGYYSTRHKSADFGTPGSTPQPSHSDSTFPFPPPPPGPPPHSPLSPTSPTISRPMGDPLKPFKSRVMDDEVPYAEANRVSTPYTQASGERTAFSSEGLRRSASVRDASRMNEESAAAATTASRARSNSPVRRQAGNKTDEHGQTRKPIVDYTTSEESVNGGHQDSSPDPHSETELAPSDRPKKTPVSRSQRSNGGPGNYTSVETDGTNAEDAIPMQQKSGNNMYATPSPFSSPEPSHFPFNATHWATQMFGLHAKRKRGPSGHGIPCWAIPSSVHPAKDKSTTIPARVHVSIASAPKAIPTTSLLSSLDGLSNVQHAQSVAYTNFRSELYSLYGSIPSNLDMDVFLKLASTAAYGQSTGKLSLDVALQRALSTYSSSMRCSQNVSANVRSSSSFNVPISQTTSIPDSSKNRSEENINTSFSPDGFSGKFTGTTDYFPPQPSRKISASPLLRTASRTAGLRTAVSNTSFPNGQYQQPMPPPPTRPSGLDEEVEESGSVDDTVRFEPEQWKKTFAEPSWAWQPSASAGPTSPSKPGVASRSSSRKTKIKPASVGTQEEPYVPDEEGSYAVPKGEPVSFEYDDAMDIDTPPPSTAAPTDTTKEPRQYPVAPSTWHRQKQKEATQQREASDASAKLTATLDDLAHVEPLARNAGSGLQGLHDLSSTLPFQSQAASTLPDHPADPQQLRLPPVPKAPEPPTKLVKQNWRAYSQAFGAYLQAYHAFNNTMLRHFATREGILQNMLNGGVAWLEATGNTVDDVGFGSYLRGVKEDEQVREVWNLGYERHTDAVSDFEKVRERVRKLATAGTLQDY